MKKQIIMPILIIITVGVIFIFSISENPDVEMDEIAVETGSVISESKPMIDTGSQIIAEVIEPVEPERVIAPATVTQII